MAFKDEESQVIFLLAIVPTAENRTNTEHPSIKFSISFS
jgi:hypothetical protein